MFRSSQLGLDLSSFGSHSLLNDFSNVVASFFDVVSERLHVVVGSSVHRGNDEAKSAVVDRVGESVTFVDDYHKRAQVSRESDARSHAIDSVPSP